MQQRARHLVPAATVVAVAVLVSVGSFADVTAGAVFMPGAVPAGTRVPVLPGAGRTTENPTAADRQGMVRWLDRLTDVARSFHGATGPAAALSSPATCPGAARLPGHTTTGTALAPMAQAPIRAHLTDLPPPTA